jgi:transcriptional regulator with XRE-family HTH domain
LSSTKLPEATSLGQRIRVAREAARLKKVDIARETGLSLSYIGRIENGKSHPSRVALQALGLALGVDPDWLAQGKGERTSMRGEVTRGDLHPTKKSQAGELDIERYLLGTPLEEALSRVPRPTRQKWAVAWQGISEQQKAEVRRILTVLANAALVLNQVPAELAKPLYRQLQQQVKTYATSVFVGSSPSEIS